MARVEPVAPPTTANGTLDPELMPTNVRNRTSKSDFDDLEGKVGGGGAAQSLASSHGFDLQLPLRIQQTATYYG